MKWETDHATRAADAALVILGLLVVSGILFW